jgi:hypothetical protein
MAKISLLFHKEISHDTDTVLIVFTGYISSPDKNFKRYALVGLNSEIQPVRSLNLVITPLPPSKLWSGNRFRSNVKAILTFSLFSPNTEAWYQAYLLTLSQHNCTIHGILYVLIKHFWHRFHSSKKKGGVYLLQKTEKV